MKPSIIDVPTQGSIWTLAAVDLLTNEMMVLYVGQSGMKMHGFRQTYEYAFEANDWHDDTPVGARNERWYSKDDQRIALRWAQAPGFTARMKVFVEISIN